MSFYEERILPYLVHLSMRHEPFAAYRCRVVPGAEGQVLEIGLGSGLNLPYYGHGVHAPDWNRPLVQAAFHVEKGGD
jgi:hypothetical protein